jgi:phosphomannomutase
MAHKVPLVKGRFMAGKNTELGLTGAQLRAARGLLALSANVLAEESKVSLRTIRRAEQDHGPVSMTKANAALIIEALEERGAVLDFSGSGGVSLRTKPKPRFGN